MLVLVRGKPRAEAEATPRRSKERRRMASIEQRRGVEEEKGGRQEESPRSNRGESCSKAPSTSTAVPIQRRRGEIRAVGTRQAPPAFRSLRKPNEEDGRQGRVLLELFRRVSNLQVHCFGIVLLSLANALLLGTQSTNSSLTLREDNDRRSCSEDRPFLLRASISSDIPSELLDQLTDLAHL